MLRHAWSGIPIFMYTSEMQYRTHVLLDVGNTAESPLHTQMSSTRMNLEGSISAAAPDYSPGPQLRLLQHADDPAGYTTDHDSRIASCEPLQPAGLT